jgi:hypothetical protein
LTVFKFPGQSIKDLASAFLMKARELDNHGFYEHRLTLVMLDRFLEGGGSNNDVPTQLYRHTLFQLCQKLDQALIRIGRLDHAAQNLYMASENLTYRDICSKAEKKNGRRSLMKINGHHRRSKTINSPLRCNLVQTSSNVQPSEPLSLRQPLLHSSNNCNKPVEDPSEASAINVATKDTGHANARTKPMTTKVQVNPTILAMDLEHGNHNPLILRTLPASNSTTAERRQNGNRSTTEKRSTGAPSVLPGVQPTGLRNTVPRLRRITPR